MVQKLNDDQVIGLLKAAQRDLDCETETVRSNAALRTARAALNAVCTELVETIQKAKRAPR
jgi:hypothetical protein